MRKIYFIFISLILCAALSGCFYPIPVNLNGTTMTAGHTGTGFGIAGDNLSGFVWYLDGELLTGQTSAVYFYAPGTEDIGTHELTVDFYQNSVSHSWTWKITVLAPLALPDNGEPQQGVE
jgi:hypothetical protein